MAQALTRIHHTLELLWSVDRTIARTWVRDLLVRASASCAAAMVALAGLAFFEVAVFLWLCESASAVTAAAAMGLANLLLAAAIALVARRRKPSLEATAAIKAHDLAQQLLFAEIEALPGEALWRLVRRLGGLLGPRGKKD